MQLAHVVAVRVLVYNVGNTKEPRTPATLDPVIELVSMILLIYTLKSKPTKASSLNKVWIDRKCLRRHHEWLHRIVDLIH